MIVFNAEAQSSPRIEFLHFAPRFLCVSAFQNIIQIQRPVAISIRSRTTT